MDILPHRPQGFTLVEVLVTVAIVAILAAIALPNYQDYVRRGRIPEATTALADLRVRMEQYFLDNRTYDSATDTARPCHANQLAALNGRLQHFVLSCASTATTYTLTATGGTSMASFAYTLNEANARATTSLPSSWGTAPNNCWAIRKGGGCS